MSSRNPVWAGLAIREGWPPISVQEFTDRSARPAICFHIGKNPKDGRYYASPNAAQIFGPTASGLRYNVLSRLLVTILVRIFEIPAIGHYDDYGPLVPSDISGTSVRTVCRVVTF